MIMAVSYDQKIFSNLSSKIGQLLFGGRTQGDINVISETLEELNSLNYNFQVVDNPTKAILLINQCCSFIPADDDVLIRKCCKLLNNLISKQDIVIEGRTLHVAVQWCLQGLKHKDKTVIVEVLQSLNFLLRTTKKCEPNIVDHVTKSVGKLIKQEKDDFGIVLLSLKCMEACSLFLDINKHYSNDEFTSLLEVWKKLFFHYLNKKPPNCDDLIFSKILITSLNGIQNIVITSPEYLKPELGYVLGIIKSFMLYGIKGIDFVSPQKLTPSTLRLPEASNTHLREKKGGKLTKQRKHKGKKWDQKVSEEWLTENKNNFYIPATNIIQLQADTSLGENSSRIKTSDSDFSDTENGKLAKTNITLVKVRQSALNLFMRILNHTEKSVVFTYWLCFFPEQAFKGQHNLLTCVLKDPSSKGRIAALNVLLYLLTLCKLYLFQAETSEKSTSFTPFSVTLGLTLIQLHKTLSLALNEISVPVLTQILKCFAALVQATPYHRLKPGIITKVVRNIKSFVYHRDVTIQVTSLIVLGCVLASEPSLPETIKTLNKTHVEQCQQKDIKSEELETNEHNFDFAEFSSDEESCPSDSDKNSWLLDKCLYNLGLHEGEIVNNSTVLPIPSPVKLESLQVLSAMSRNYFDKLLSPHLTLIAKVLELSFNDNYMDVQLHAGRTLDFVGQAINRSLNEEPTTLKLDQCVSFWMSLLNGPLIKILQNSQHAILRAVGCDCVGSIGAEIFEKLPRDKQFLCVTLLFSCTRDEENSVRGAAVRALAICVLYPSLNEDMGFIVDTAEAIHNSLKDDNLTVRVKASWSLGNLSDALVMNRSIVTPYEALPSNLLLRLLEDSVNSAKDNDKVKMNTVRSLGNLLQLIDDERYNDETIKNIVHQAFIILVKSSTSGSNMKVRWNACYALGKAMKNNSLYSSTNWQNTVFQSLTGLVVSFRNFKVRINAALALMSPSNRDNYGQFYHSVWKALLQALETSENMEDLNEYKHRDNLVEQICLSLGHLISQLNEDDLLPLTETILLYYENFKQNMHKVIERLIPEKSSTLFSAYERLKIFKSNPKLNLEIIQKLMDVCLSVYAV